MAGDSSGGPFAPGPAGGRKPPQAAGPPPDRMPPVEVPTNEHAQASTAAPAPLLVDLQHHPIERERVVPGDAPLVLVAKDLVEVLPTHRDEGAAGIGRGAAKARVAQEAAWDDLRVSGSSRAARSKYLSRRYAAPSRLRETPRALRNTRS